MSKPSRGPGRPPRRIVRAPVPGASSVGLRVGIIVAVVFALARLVPTAVRLLSDWARAPNIFVGDFAVIDLYLQRGLRGALWVGPYSRYGWHHPGPLWFYGMLPVYALSGRAPMALVAWNLALALLSLSLSVWLLARRITAPATVLAASLLALLVPQLGEQLVYPWNPFVIVGPFLLLIVVATLTIIEGWRWAPALVFLHAFLAQTHLGVLPVSTLCAGASLALLAVRSSPAPLPRPRWALLGALVAFAVLWAAPLLDQLRAPVGNITLLARFFSDPTHAPQPWDGVLTAWARVTFGLFLRPLGISPGVPLAAALGSTTAVAFAVGLRAAIRRRDPLAICLCGFSLLTLACGLLSARAVVGDIRGYLFAWSTVATLPGIIGVAHLGTRQSPQRSTTALVYGAAAILCLGSMAGAEATVRGVPIFDHELARSTTAISDAIGAPRGQTVLVRQSEHDQWPDMAAIIDQLYLRGHRVTFSPDWVFMFGAPFDRPTTPHGAIVQLLSPALPNTGPAATVECLARAPHGWRSIAVGGPRAAICVAIPR